MPVAVEETCLFRGILDGFVKSDERFSIELITSRFIFDVIARVFNFPLHAQSEEGIPILNDLKDMITLAEAGLSWTPVVKVKAFFRKRVVKWR